MKRVIFLWVVGCVVNPDRIRLDPEFFLVLDPGLFVNDPDPAKGKEQINKLNFNRSIYFTIANNAITKMRVGSGSGWVWNSEKVAAGSGSGINHSVFTQSGGEWNVLHLATVT